MKLVKLFAIVAVALLASCSPKVDSNKYLIEGCLKNIPDSVVINLFAKNDAGLRKVTADTVFDGRFSFSDTISEVKQLFLVIHADGFTPTKLPVWVAPGEYVRVSGDDNVYMTWKVSSDLAEQNDQNTLQEYVVDACREFTSLYLEAVATKKQWMAKMGEDINDSVLLEKYRSLDATAMRALYEIYRTCKASGLNLILSHTNEQPLSVMKKAGFVENVGEEYFCAHIDEALVLASKITV